VADVVDADAVGIEVLMVPAWSVHGITSGYESIRRANVRPEEMTTSGPKADGQFYKLPKILASHVTSIPPANLDGLSG
jgi:hypothetical protein